MQYTRPCYTVGHVQICYLSWKVSRLQKEDLGYERVISIKNMFVNIFYFVNESHFLIRKVNAVKKSAPQLHKGFIMASSKLCQNFIP